MQQPTQSTLNQIRNAGFRPEVVGCFLQDKKILFLYAQKYALWQLPQGGIDNGENLKKTFFREMTEELGEKFIENCSKKLVFFGEDAIEFPAHHQNLRDLKNDAGKSIFMRGKKYFFLSTQAKAPTLDISQTEFDDFRWVSFEEGLDLCQKIYQANKKRLTLNILNSLKKIGLL